MKEVLSNHGYQVNIQSDTENNIHFLELIDKKSVEYPEEIATLLVNAGYPPKSLNCWEKKIWSIIS